MKRSLFFCVLSFLLGIYCLGFDLERYLPAIVITAALLILCLMLFEKGRPVYAALLLCFLLGALSIDLTADTGKNPLSPYVGEYVTLTGEVISDVTVSETSGRRNFTARVTGLSFLGEQIYLKEQVHFSMPANEKPPEFGQGFLALCLLQEPDTGENSGGFDYALYLKAHDISYIATVEPSYFQVSGDFPLSFTQQLHRLNRRAGAKISALLPQDVAGLIRAVSFGDTTQISKEMEERLSCSGLSHAVSVSGMHVNVLLTALYGLFSFFRGNRYCRGYISLGIVLILLYVCFTGASYPAIRAAIMAICVMAAPLFRRRADGLTALGLASFLLTICNPFAAFDVGFLLSFSAMLGILLLTRPIERALLSLVHLPAYGGRLWQRTIRSTLALLCATFGAQLLILPVASWVFGYVSLWSFITNLLTAFVMPFMMVGGILMGFLALVHPYLAHPVALVAGMSARGFCLTIEYFGTLQKGLVTVPSFGVFAGFLFALGIFAFYHFLKGHKGKAVVAAVGLFLLLLLFFAHGAIYPVAKLSFINVGQGDSALAQLPGGVKMLIDGGGAISYDETEPYDVGREVVLPYLRKEGITKLDYMIASHPHEDHMNGLNSLLEEIPVDTLLVPLGFEQAPLGQKLLEKAEGRGTKIIHLASGDSLSLSKDCTIEVLLPDTDWLSMAKEENDKTLVFSLLYGNNRILFMGDLTETGEAYLVEHHKGMETNLLKVGHHGSPSSTSKAFLAWAKPAYAFIPCGENHFGHPGQEVLSRLAGSGTVVYRADYDKDVSFYFTKENLASIHTGGKSHDEN